MIKKIPYFLLLLFINSYGQQKCRNLTEIEKIAKEKYLSFNKLQEFCYDSSTVFDAGDVINGNVMVRNGNLTLGGVINGDVLVVYGDVKIRNGARIDGNITCIDGTIYQAENSVVIGNQIETYSKNLIKTIDWKLEKEKRKQEKQNENWIANDYYGRYGTIPFGFWEKQFLFRYNPVQGLFTGISIPENVEPFEKYFDLYGFVGYGFSETRWSYSGGINRWLFDPYHYRFEIGVKGYDYTSTNDGWIITPLENTLTSIFLHANYQDYYGYKGFEFHASQNLSIFFRGTIAFRNDEYTSLENNTNWALLYPSRKYHKNIAIEEGNMRSVYGELYYDTRNNKNTPISGWYGKLSMEISNDDIGSSFNFNKYELDLRTYQRVGKMERIDVRILAGSADHHLPIQKYFYLGGFSSLRGFSYKEFSGNRFFLTNVEYNISPKLMFSDSFLGAMHFIILFDVGKAWFADENDKWYQGFSAVSINDIKFNYGIALSSYDGNFRLAVAKRTDRSSNAINVVFRLRKPF